jgi:hypothetical protein
MRSALKPGRSLGARGEGERRDELHCDGKRSVRFCDLLYRSGRRHLEEGVEGGSFACTYDAKIRRQRELTREKRSDLDDAESDEPSAASRAETMSKIS